MKLFTCALVIFLAVLHTPVYAQNAALPDPASRAAARKLLVAIDFRVAASYVVALAGLVIYFGFDRSPRSVGPAAR